MLGEIGSWEPITGDCDAETLSNYLAIDALSYGGITFGKSIPFLALAIKYMQIKNCYLVKVSSYSGLHKSQIYAQISTESYAD